MTETRAVLAGAYIQANPRSYLTHSVDDAETPLCGRVRADSIADAGATNPEAPPTCLLCYRRDPRFRR